MRFAEINLFGVYVAPISVMIGSAWLSKVSWTRSSDGRTVFQQRTRVAPQPGNERLDQLHQVRHHTAPLHDALPALIQRDQRAFIPAPRLTSDVGNYSKGAKIPLRTARDGRSNVVRPLLGRY